MRGHPWKRRLRTFHQVLQEASWHRFSGETAVSCEEPGWNWPDNSNLTCEEHRSNPGKAESCETFESGCAHLQDQGKATQFITASLRFPQHPTSLGLSVPTLDRSLQFSSGGGWSSHQVRLGLSGSHSYSTVNTELGLLCDKETSGLLISWDLFKFLI